MTEPAQFHLDRASVRASFDRASATYESAAGLQALVVRELLGRLDAFGLKPAVVLDLGAGTGRGTRELKRRYPRATVIALDLAPGMLREAGRHQLLWRRFERVCGDAQRLPLAAASVDLVFSSLMLQWCEPLDAAFGEVRRVLKATGFMTATRNPWARSPRTSAHATTFLRTPVSVPVMKTPRALTGVRPCVSNSRQSPSPRRARGCPAPLPSSRRRSPHRSPAANLRGDRLRRRVPCAPGASAR